MQKKKIAKVVSINGYEDVPPSEKSLQKAVAHQPVSVAIEASGRAFQLYQSVCPLPHFFVCLYATSLFTPVLVRMPEPDQPSVRQKPKKLKL